MPPMRPDRKTGLDLYSPFPSSNAANKIEAAQEEGRQMVQEQDAATALLGMKSATLTPEEIAEFESAVDEEFAKFTTGGRRKKMRGGEVSEVIAKSSELWSAILKTMATPENAAIGLVAGTVGIASPALVHSAFSVARAALDVAAQAITPETVAFTSCAALVYYYFGDKLIPKDQPIVRQMAIDRMNNAIATAKTARRASSTLRVVIDKFKEDLDKSKSVTNWEATEDEALLEVQKKLGVDTAPSKLGVNEVKPVKPQGPSVGNYSTNTGSQVNTAFSSTSLKTAPPPPPSKSAKFFGGSRRRTKRHRRLSAPTRKRRSSSARRRGDTR